MKIRSRAQIAEHFVLEMRSTVNSNSAGGMIAKRSNNEQWQLPMISLKAVRDAILKLGNKASKDAQWINAKLIKKARLY